MKTALCLVIVACVAGSVLAQHGSVHCGVGCACAQTKEPVCGTDGNTYLNECFLRCEQCKTPGLERQYEGECHELVYRYEISQLGMGWYPYYI